MSKEELAQKIGNLECEIYELKARLLQEKSIKADLLEALQSIVSDFEFCEQDSSSWGDRTAAYVETARAAIAKATGESA